MEKIIVAAPVAKEFTDIIIGNAWNGVDAKGRAYINASINEEFEGKEIVLTGGSRFVFKGRTTPKRVGINPLTNKEYRDPDWMITIEPAV